jgi:hypothetical protein
MEKPSIRLQQRNQAFTCAPLLQTKAVRHRLHIVLTIRILSHWAMNLPCGSALKFYRNKFGLFNYATQKTGGYVDFDWFKMIWIKQ